MNYSRQQKSAGSWRSLGAASGSEMGLCDEDARVATHAGHAWGMIVPHARFYSGGRCHRDVHRRLEAGGLQPPCPSLLKVLLEVRVIDEFSALPSACA